jgi:hypothetical protein
MQIKWHRSAISIVTIAFDTRVHHVVGLGSTAMSGPADPTARELASHETQGFH